MVTKPIGSLLAFGSGRKLISVFARPVLSEKGFDIAYFGDPKFVGWGGGVPVWRNGEVVGSVAVSGLPSEEDMELATFGAGLVEGT